MPYVSSLIELPEIDTVDWFAESRKHRGSAVPQVALASSERLKTGTARSPKFLSTSSEGQQWPVVRASSQRPGDQIISWLGVHGHRGGSS